MGKAERNRELSAREKVAAQRAVARQTEQRRRLLIAACSVTVVIAVVVALIVIKSLGGGGGTKSEGTAGAVSTVAATVGRDIANVSATTLDKVGAGLAYPAKGGIYPHAIQTISPAGPVLTSNGKPEIVYVGGEYCPYCAAERWAVAVALSRFGSFSGLRLIHSTSADVDPSTPTLSFYKSTYTSKYLTFSPTEAATVSEQPLQPETALDKTLMTKYDAPPYIPASAAGSFPFVDMGNRYVIDGASYDPGLLANLTWAQIGADLANPNSLVGKAIDGTANRITAAVCKLTHNQPGAVCTSKAVTSATGSI